MKLGPDCCGACWRDLGCNCQPCACGHCLCAHEKMRFHRICKHCTPVAYQNELGGVDCPDELGDWSADQDGYSERYGAELARHKPKEQPA